MKLRFPKGVRNFEVPIYGQRVYLTTKQDEVDAIDRYMHGGRIEWELRRRHSFCTYEVQEHTGIPLFLMVLRRPIQAPCVVHECGHLALMIAERVGLKVSYEDQEPFCYLLDYLFLKVNEELKR